MHFLFFVIFGHIFQTVSSLLVTGPFRHCQTNGIKGVWDLPESCIKRTESSALTETYFTVLAKGKHMVLGNGWHCKRTKILMITYQNIFWMKWINIHESQEKVSHEECRTMASSKNMSLPAPKKN